MKKIFAVVVFLIVTSCSSSENYFEGEIIVYDSFLINGELNSMDTLPVSIIGIGSLSLQDSLLLINTSGQKANLSIFNLNNYEISENICLTGRGPDEYVFFLNYGQYTQDFDKICLYTFNANLSAPILNVSDSWQKNRTVIEEEKKNLKIFEDVGGLIFREGVFFLNNNNIFVKYKTSYRDVRDNIYQPAEYAIFNAQGDKKIIKFFGKDLPYNPQFPKLMELIYNGSTRIKPDGSRIVDGMFYMDYINFIDLEEKSAFGLRYHDALSYEDLKKISEEEYSKKAKYAYNDLFVTDNYVFGLYRGDYKIADSQDKFANMCLRIFDWEGTPLASLKTDRTIVSIAFNEKSNLLYALDTEEKIYIYDLNETMSKINHAI